MKTEKSCNNCIYSIPDWTNVCNSDHYCSNEESEEYGYNAEYLNGCDEWKSIENLGNNDSICTKTRVNDEDRTTGDCISRQQAIDAINNCYCGGEDSCGEPWIYEDDAIKAVEQLPSAHSTQTNADLTQCNTLDCVSRQQAIDALDKHIDTFDAIDKNYLCGLRTAMSILKEMPSAQPERKTARWEILYPNHTYKYHCSECGANHKYMFDFCPSCGARMDGESDE